MKKISVSLLFTALVLSSFPAFAAEEAPPLVLKSVESKVEGPGLPFEFSFDGKLSEAVTGKIFTSGTHAPDFTLPSLKEEPAPIRYPRWAVREGWQGRFVIAVEILTSGEVGRWKVVESTGYPLLDRAATQAIRRWRFHPGMEKGRSLVSCIQIPILFQLEEEFHVR